jgi:hypothetical protein
MTLPMVRVSFHLIRESDGTDDMIDPNCGSQGFQTSKGWDPVTGLGTPNYPRMLEYFLSLP